VIYVRDGDKARGEWAGVIQSQTADHITYLTTAKLGRIDASAEKSELVCRTQCERNFRRRMRATSLTPLNGSQCFASTSISGAVVCWPVCASLTRILTRWTGAS